MSVPDSPRTVKSGRLVSLDVLRGFAMFWIIGGGPFVLALVHYFGSGYESFVGVIEYQSEHVGWDGLVAWDLIFPTFVFVSGATMPFALTRKLEHGISKWTLHARLFQRMLLLVFLGMSTGLLRLDFANMRPFSVLGLIGVAYFIAGVIVLNRGIVGQFAWLLGILLGYWAAVWFIPVPGTELGRFTPGGCLPAYIDWYLIPGKFYGGVFDPEGLLTLPPAGALALMGALAGRLLMDNAKRPYLNVLILAAAGVVSLGLGFLLNLSFPIIKALWTSSFVLAAGGWALLLLAVFYLVIDVWRMRWLGFFFIPIGMNSITIYVGNMYIDFEYTANRVFGGLARVSGEELAPIVATAGLLAVEWAMLYFLYRKNIFLRV